MKITRYFALISLLFFSCNGRNSSAIDKKNVFVTETKNVSKTNEKILLTKIETHFFSDVSKKDTFKLILTGDSLRTSGVVFSIISYNGEQIYYDSFGGEDLIGIRNIENPTLSEVENSIRSKVSIFFNDSNFANANKIPAVATCGDHGIPDSVNWFDIHRDKSVVGFHYFFEGEIDDKYIAWSKKQHKVVIYWHNND